MAYSKAELKRNGDKAFLVSDHSESRKNIRQIFASLDLHCMFHVNTVVLFHWDTKLNGDIKQKLTFE